jgi:hypothetical protein
MIQARPADMRGGRVIEELFLDGVAVEPGDRAEPPGDGRPSAAAGLQVTGEAPDVRAAGGERPDLALLTPGRVLA